MGCFEITFSEDILLSAVLINFNMGCFEIIMNYQKYYKATIDKL